MGSRVKQLELVSLSVFLSLPSPGVPEEQIHSQLIKHNLLKWQSCPLCN